MAFLRQTFLLGISAGLSWWVFLGFDRTDPASEVPAPLPLPVVLTPVALESSEPEAAAEPAPDSTPPVADETAAPPEPTAPESEPESSPEPAEVAAVEDLPEPEAETPPDPGQAPPPSELGAPDGEGEVAAAEEAEGESRGVSVEAAMSNEGLLSAAKAELSGEVRPGFATVLLAAPEIQWKLARFFGEELVLVPKSALDGDPSRAGYFRLSLDGPPRVEHVRGIESLERYRQYRDLFDYEYARLPQPLRELRRSVLSRSEVYLFGALLPAREWAVVVQRRREALDASGRALDDARRFVLRYEARPHGGFDLRVEEIVFADGTRFRPAPSTPNRKSP